ncbi:MAG: hypothetical protein IT350_13205 [Deltaproteobacteria bacterium]|nr:hypothetical protein [Deltaproteobacteria bacterium]
MKTTRIPIADTVRRMRARKIAAAAIACALAACADGDRSVDLRAVDSAHSLAPTPSPPTVELEEDSRVVREYTLVPGEPAPPNPLTGAVTPDEFNVIPLFRFRLTAPGGAVMPARAIVITQAGYVAGANQMFHIARTLVEMSGGDVEVWVPDKRHTLLEDHFGMDRAEARRDPWLAYRYYILGEEVEGHSYQDVDAWGPETDMMSEWGLDLWMKDMRRLVHLVPEESRRANVFIAGDSRGVAFAQAFAAYEFEDGVQGGDEIAGLILWDGAVRPDPDVNETTYPQEIAMIRSGATRRTEPMDAASTWFMEVFGMAAAENFGDPDDPTLGPEGFFPDYAAFESIYWMLMRGQPITLTNEAFFGVVLDSDYLPYPKFMGHLGRLTGGPIREGLLGDVPTDVDAVYRWQRYDECDPPELVDIQQLIRMLWEGPSNFTDLHYSARLDLDLLAATPFESEGTWVHDHFQLYTSLVDAPVFALISLNYHGEGIMEAYRDALPPVRGSALPRSETGFVLIDYPQWSHLDAIAVEEDRNPVYPKLLAWLRNWSSGEVAVPTF